MHTEFYWGNLSKGGHLEDPGIDGRIILGRICEKWVGRGCMDWTDMALERDRWRAFVNAIMNLRVP